MAAIYFYIWAAFVWGCFLRSDGLNMMCPSACSCLGDYVDCSRMGLVEIPKDLPTWVTDLEIQTNGISDLYPEDFKGLVRLQKIDLSNNQLTHIPDDVYVNVPALKELIINNNKLRDLPVLKGNPVLTKLDLTNNNIISLNLTTLSYLKHLDALDLSQNKIMEVPNGSFPSNLSLTKLSLRNNEILSLEAGCFQNLTNLESLKLNKNSISHLAKGVFNGLENLLSLDLSKNQLTKLMGLTFEKLGRLEMLKLRKNSLTTLEDGAFFGLTSLQTLILDDNNISSITQDWLFGLDSLKQLFLSNNRVHQIEPKAWAQVPQLQIVKLQHNDLVTIGSDSFLSLTTLTKLLLGNNRIQIIQDEALDQLTSLEELDLSGNAISSTIEDVKGVFTKLAALKVLELRNNRIKMITKQAFIGLTSLEQLYLSNNNITSIQGTAFEPMPNLRQLTFNTTSLFCDCQLSWLPMWLRDNNFEHSVVAKCAHPNNLHGSSIFLIDSSEFKCDGHFLKPEIVLNPRSQVVLKGENITLNCSAASTEAQGSPTHFEWKKDNNLLTDVHTENFAKRSGNLTHYVSKLHISDAQDLDAGRYQCVISNDFGSAYSKRANINVYVYPKFIKPPQNVTAKARTQATLVCAASGQPKPIISWQKDGGFDHFPAAQERRMHVIPEDDHFYIVNVKAADEGVYSCIAKNDAGTIMANMTLTVLQTPSFVQPMEAKTTRIGVTTVLECLAQGSPQPKLTWYRDGQPLVPSQRHFFTAEDQLLVIVETELSDAGDYTCEMSNTLGTIRGTSTLTVSTGSASDDRPDSVGGGLDDESTTTGIIIIAVVCCVVGTSLVWVIIIYQTRKRQELYSATPTDETTLPGEVPSSGYMSSDKEGSYTQGLPITNIQGYQYHDMQMKESGYESSSGRFRAARSGAIFQSEVDNGDGPQKYQLVPGDRHYMEQSDENSMSSQEYPRSDSDSLKSEINSVNSSQSGRQPILTTFQPHSASRELLQVSRSRSCSATHIVPVTGTTTDLNKSVCSRADNSVSSQTDEDLEHQSCPFNDEVCKKLGEHRLSSDGHQCKHYTSPTRLRHTRHKDHSHFDRSQPPGHLHSPEQQDCVISAAPVFDENIPTSPQLVPCPTVYLGQAEYDGAYVPTSGPQYLPIYHPINTPCDCHVHLVPPSKHGPHREHLAHPDMGGLYTNSHNQRINAMLGCLHPVNGMGAAWHGHAYTLPYLPSHHVHSIQTLPTNVSPPRNMAQQHTHPQHHVQQQHVNSPHLEQDPSSLPQQPVTMETISAEDSKEDSVNVQHVQNS